MTDATIPPTETIAAEQKKLCLMLYGIFAVSLVLQFINLATIVLGSAAIMAGIILAYIERKKAQGTIYGNHLQYLIRTFWIGGAVYLPIVTVIGTIIITMNIDMSPLQEANSTGEATVEGATQALLAANKGLIVKTMLAMTAPFVIWWFWRLGYGYKRLTQGKKIPNPMSWF